MTLFRYLAISAAALLVSISGAAARPTFYVQATYLGALSLEGAELAAGVHLTPNIDVSTGWQHIEGNRYSSDGQLFDVAIRFPVSKTFALLATGQLYTLRSNPKI